MPLSEEQSEELEALGYIFTEEEFVKNSIAFCDREVNKTGLLSLFFRLDTDIKFVTGETRCHTKRLHTTVGKRLR